MKKINNFIIDANTLLSAFLLSKSSVAAMAYYKCKENGVLVMSKDTFNELSDVFIRPKFDKYISIEKRMIILEDLKKLVKFISVKTHIKVCRDPKDDKYLSLAVASKASCIITGDKDLLVLHPFENVPILTARDFLDNF